MLSSPALLLPLALLATRSVVAARYSGLVCLLMTTLTVMACAAVLPCVHPRSGRTYRLAGLAAIAAAMMVWCGRELDQVLAMTTPEELFIAMCLTLALVIGVCSTWVVDVLRQRLIRLEEETLLVALLLAAVPPVLAPNWFPVGIHPRALATWFLHGVFWQLLCTYCIPPWHRLFPLRPDPIDTGVLDCHRTTSERFPRPSR